MHTCCARLCSKSNPVVLLGACLRIAVLFVLACGVGAFVPVLRGIAPFHKPELSAISSPRPVPPTLASTSLESCRSVKGVALEMVGGSGAVQKNEEEEDDEDDYDDEDEDGIIEDDVSLGVRMDALRRMQKYKEIQSGQTLLESGRLSQTDIPLEVDVMEAKDWLKKSNKEESESKRIFLLDCREQDEYEFCRIDGSTLIPLSEMRTRYLEVPADQQVLVYCHHGMRSMQVTRYLRTKGLKRVTNMQGGIDEWSNRVDRSVPQY